MGHDVARRWRLVTVGEVGSEWVEAHLALRWAMTWHARDAGDGLGTVGEVGSVFDGAGLTWAHNGL